MGKSLEVSVVREATLEVVFRCGSVAEAEAFVAGVALVDKEAVEAGAYGIDAPEELVNAR